VREEERKQYLTYYLIAAHPGCTREDMVRLRRFCSVSLRLLPRQVQVFTPTPSTYATLMYWTQRDPFSGAPCFVEKSVAGREQQKQVFFSGGPGMKKEAAVIPRKKRSGGRAS
jgi:radical SAM superfamily enzyme YgiQ (UPF0313 family)